MIREITIRDWRYKKIVISVRDFETVLKIEVEVISGDEVMTIYFQNGSELTHDSSHDRLHDFEDTQFCIYDKGKIDLIDNFSRRNSSYDKLNTAVV